MVKTLSQYDEKLDQGSLLERLEGNQEFLNEVIQLFLGEAPHLIDAMRKALQKGDMQELGRSAHSMKGAASNFSPYGTARAASQLEKDAKSGDVESAKTSLATLEVVVERMLSQLLDMCQGSAK